MSLEVFISTPSMTEKDVDFFLEINYREICETLQGGKREKNQLNGI